MDKGILNQSFLEKDIAKITFYASEEQKLLIKIYKKMEECSNNYNTNNKSLFLSTISNFISNVEKISTKRLDYTKVLKKAIIQYITLSNQTVSILDKYDINGDV